LESEAETIKLGRKAKHTKDLGKKGGQEIRTSIWWAY